MELWAYFAEHPRIALAFSGGADSACLLACAKAAGVDVCAYYVQSAFQPAFELEDAEKLCAQLSVPLRVLPLDVLALSRVAENGPQRCYYCKQAIFRTILTAADEDGYRLVVDGTNASDPEDDRPGMRALRELGIQSPLRICGLGKKDVRRISREMGLFTHDKPAYACLATRVQGTELTEALLRKVEEAERAVAALGFVDFRVRTDGENARLELLEDQLPGAKEKWTEICECLSAFKTVRLDSRLPRD